MISHLKPLDLSINYEKFINLYNSGLFINWSIKWNMTDTKLKKSNAQHKQKKGYDLILYDY